MRMTTPCLTMLLQVALLTSPGAAAGAEAQQAGDDQAALQGEPEAVQEAAAPGETSAGDLPSTSGGKAPDVRPAMPEPGDRLALTAPTTSMPSSGSMSRPDRIASGERVTVRNGDFSLEPPKGWEVYEHLANLTLLMQIPHQEGIKYQRTIQVAGFTGPRYIDETTAKEYEEVITRKFSASSSAIENYRIRNHMGIEMKDGRQGLLFYTEFTLNAVALMQAHILVSSGSRHYLMTFTDLAEHFEGETANQYLTEAWDSMISVQLGGTSPARFAVVTYGGAIAVALFILALIFVGVRRFLAARQYKNYANGDSDDTLEHSSDARSLSGIRRVRSRHVPTKHSEAAAPLSRSRSAKKAAKTKHQEDDEEDSAARAVPPPSVARPQPPKKAPPPTEAKKAPPPPAKKPQPVYAEAEDESMGLDIDDEEAS